MPALPGIESVPAKSPPEIRNFLSQVRRRLLAIGNQFTDAQVAALLALIGAERTVTNVTNTTVTGSAPVFLASQAPFFNGNSQGSWLAVDAKAFGVPAGASAIMLMGEYSNFSGGDAEVSVDISIDPLAGNIFRLLKGFRSQSEPTIGGQAGMFPLRPDATFDFRMTGSFTGGAGCQLYVIGYFRAAS